MSVSAIDTNTWYTIESVFSDYPLAWTGGAPSTDDSSPIAFVNNTTITWQFLDYGTASGTTASNSYFMRPIGYEAYCMDMSSGSLLLDICSASSTQWGAEANTTDPENVVWVLYADNSDDVLAAEPDGSTGAELVSNITGDNEQIVQMYIYSASQINDDAFSTLPYASATSSAAMSSGGGSSPSSTGGSLAAASSGAASITSSPTATYGGSPSEPSMTYFDESIIDKSVKDLGVIPSVLLLPQDTNVGCENCTVSGYASVVSGNCDDISDCIESGYVDISLSEINANMSIDIQLLPGFELKDSFMSLVNVTLGTVRITDKISLQFTLDFGIPLDITLGTPVIFTGGFTLEWPDATFTFALHDISASDITGLENISISHLPFHVSGPNAQFTLLTGLMLRIHADAIIDPSEDVDVTGELLFEIGVPRVNLTAQVESNVDDNCNPSSESGTHDHAVSLTYEVDAGVWAKGILDVKSTYYSKSWDSDDFPSDLNEQILGNSTCLYGDSLEADFLKAVEGNSGARMGGKVEWWWYGVLGIVITWLLQVV